MPLPRAVVSAFLAVTLLAAQDWKPQIPKVWDDAAVKEMDLPLVGLGQPPRYPSSDYYYRMKPITIYKTYPVYVIEKEPPGYMDWLKQQEPEIVADPSKLKTKQDWIRAGEQVFFAPVFTPAVLEGRARAFPRRLSMATLPPLRRNVTAEGIVLGTRYVIEKKGDVRDGGFLCSGCHIRTAPDGRAIPGAPPTLSINALLASIILRGANSARAQDELQRAQLGLWAPWLKPGPTELLPVKTVEDLIPIYEAIPGGTFARDEQILAPQKMPDLIGIKDRKYLDASALVRHRSIGDLMRYAALVEISRMPQLAEYGDYGRIQPLPPPETRWRFTDEQLYALALYLYSIEPPENPNKPGELSRRGEKVFQREGCQACHPAPLYTNNMLTPAKGFQIPADHRKKYDILDVVVGTDPTLAMHTRRGTGYYRIPWLKARGTAARSSTAARWRRSKTGSTRLASATTTCPGDSKASGSRRAPCPGTSSD